MFSRGLLRTPFPMSLRHLQVKGHDVTEKLSSRASWVAADPDMSVITENIGFNNIRYYS